MRNLATTASFVLFLVFLPIVGAQEAPERKKVAARGVVFQVTGKEGGEIWLAGSVHLLRASDYPLPAAYEEGYSAAKQVFFEIPPNELESPEATAVIQQSSVYTDGSGLKDHLSPEGYQQVAAYAEKKGMPMAQLQGFKPWMLALVIGMQEFTKRGFKPELGLDAFFETKAAKDGKTVKGLETVEFQMGLFANLPDEQQEDLLLSTLENHSDAEEFIADLMNAWSKGDPKNLSKVMNEAMEDYPALGKALLYDRNKNWLQPIEAVLESKVPTLIVVGAGHLCGKGSVVDLLEKKGYKVVQQ